MSAGMVAANLRETIREVTEALPITERVFYDLKASQPLVEELVRRVEAHQPAGGGGRLLAVAANESLAQVLLHLGYDLDLWQVPQAVISSSLRARVVRAAPLDELLRSHGPGDHYRCIVLPYVVEAAADPPASVLASLATRLEAGGALVTALRLGVIGGRLRRQGGGPGPAPVSLSWPSLPPVRIPDLDQLRLWCSQAGLGIIDGAPVIDQTATVAIRQMSLSRWLLAHLAHGARLAIPGLRECYAATLVKVQT
jgi:hypothetical protein